MAQEKVVAIDTAGKLAVQNLDLVNALNECIPVIEDQLATIISSYCTPDGKGGHLLSTLSDDGREDFERFTRALLAARKAIKKAGAI